VLIFVFFAHLDKDVCMAFLGIVRYPKHVHLPAPSPYRFLLAKTQEVVVEHSLQLRTTTFSKKPSTGCCDFKLRIMQSTLRKYLILALRYSSNALFNRRFFQEAVAL
jgi:hypothetical protein